VGRRSNHLDASDHHGSFIALDVKNRVWLSLDPPYGYGYSWLIFVFAFSSAGKVVLRLGDAIGVGR
jgi:hypothetical protein